jgi:hypothetical protein
MDNLQILGELHIVANKSTSSDANLNEIDVCCALLDGVKDFHCAQFCRGKKFTFDLKIKLYATFSRGQIVFNGLLDYI